MNNSHSIVTVVLCCALIAVVGCNSKEAAGPAAGADAAPTISVDRVTAGAPTKKTLQLFTEQPGRVFAFEETPILSKLPGYVESVQFDIGDKVTKGQVLMRIHAPEYKDQLEQKRGLLGQAEAQVKQAQAALVAAEAASNSSKSMVAQAEAGLVERTLSTHVGIRNSSVSSSSLAKVQLHPSLQTKLRVNSNPPKPLEKRHSRLLSPQRLANEKPRRTC